LDYWGRVQGRVWLRPLWRGMAMPGIEMKILLVPNADSAQRVEKTTLLACCGDPCCCPEHRPMVRPGKHADRLVVWLGRSGDVRARRNGGVVKWAQTKSNTQVQRGEIAKQEFGIHPTRRTCPGRNRASARRARSYYTGALWKQGTPRPGVETTSAVGPVRRHPWVRGLWERKEAGFRGGSVLARASPVYLERRWSLVRSKMVCGSRLVRHASHVGNDPGSIP
jgi:hypothetical protein